MGSLINNSVQLLHDICVGSWSYSLAQIPFCWIRLMSYPANIHRYICGVLILLSTAALGRFTVASVMYWLTLLGTTADAEEHTGTRFQVVFCAKAKENAYLFCVTEITQSTPLLQPQSLSM